MTKLPRKTNIVLAVLVLLTIAVPAFAGDPPSRVMRLKYMNGQVSFQPGGVDDWVAATLNRPLTTADRIWTDKDSRAELSLATASLRMDSETSLTVSNLSDNAVQVELDQGVLNIHVRKLYGGEVYEVDTPNVAFTLLKSGDYRFEVDPNGDTTTVIVRRGKGEGNGNGRGVEVESGEMARFEHGNTMMHTMAKAPREDGFDDWCRVRDKREDKYESVRYVSDDVVGYEDLDEYGYWRSVPTYGNVWIPRGVAVGWAPYRYGHWAWIEPWGWTWIDDARWGFAPFHYGRWIYSSYGWSWCPGPRHYRAVYAPALVAWFGGSNWGVGISFGGGYGVGWVPLGWGEPYYPYYRASHNYVRNVNISNTHIKNITYVTNNYTTIINNKNNNHNFQNVKYINQGVNGGMTAVPAGVLQHGRPVAKSVVAVNDRDLGSARFTHSADVAPARAGVLGGRENVPAALPPSGAMNRHVVTKMTPPQRPDKFENRQPFIERNHGMAVDSDTMARMRKEAPPASNVNKGMPGASSESALPNNADRGRPMGNGQGRPGNADIGRPTNADAGRPDNPGKSVNADNNRPMNDGARSVPRPPERDSRVINLDRSGKNNAENTNHDVAQPGNSAREANDNGSRSTQRYVPRPPSERRPAMNAEGTPAPNSTKQNAGNNRVPDSMGRPVPRPTSDNYKATAPEDRRSPVFDRKPEVNNDQRKSVEAEVSAPRNVPRPPEGSQVRNSDTSNGNSNRPTSDTIERRSAPDVNQRRNAPDVSERRSAPDTSERRAVPQPSAEKRSAPETRSEPAARPQQQREERHAAPPADKPSKGEPAPKKSSMQYSDRPDYAESRYSDRPSYSPRMNSFAARESSSYSPRPSSYSAPVERSVSYSRPSAPSRSMSYSRPSSSSGGGMRSYNQSSSRNSSATVSSSRGGGSSHSSSPSSHGRNH